MPMTRLTRTLALAAAALAVAAAAFVSWRQTEPPAALLQPQDARLVARGEQVYRAQCAACHGARLEGQPNWREPGPDRLLPAPPHDPSGHTWHHPDAQLFAITKYGVARAAQLPDHRSAMPAFEGVLGDDDIAAVLSWIKAQWPEEIRAKHDRINAQAREAAR